MKYGPMVLLCFCISLAGTAAAHAAGARPAEAGFSAASLSLGPDGSFRLKFMGLSGTFNWEAGESSVNPPELAVHDYDGDGLPEAAVVVHIGSGTGVSLSDLHIIKVEGGALRDYAYTADACARDFSRAVSHEALLDKGAARVRSSADSGVVTVDISRTLAENELSGAGLALVQGDIVLFALREGGVIEATVPLGFTSKENATPLYIASQSALVVFDKGAFSLAKVRVTADE